MFFAHSGHDHSIEDGATVAAGNSPDITLIVGAIFVAIAVIIAAVIVIRKK